MNEIERNIHERMQNEHRAKNLFFDQIYRLTILLGTLLLVAFLTQIYALKTEGKMILAAKREALSYGEKEDQNGQKYRLTHYMAPTKDDQHNYYINEIAWWHIFRRLAGVLFTRFYQNTGWVPEIVNDIALRWLWVFSLIALWLLLRAIVSIRLSILLARQGRGEVDGLVVSNFKPLYHDRFPKYIVVMAVTIAGPVRHAIFWPVLGAIYVVVAELRYMLWLVMATNPLNPYFAKRHWWVRMAIRIHALTGLEDWRETNNVAWYWICKITYSIFFTITWPFRKGWESIKAVFVEAAERYDRKKGYEDLGDYEEDE